MWYKTLVIPVAWISFSTYVFGGAEQEAITTTQELVNGVIARSEAIFCGKIEYLQKRGFVDSAERFPEGEYQVVFSGPSWKVYSKYTASEIPFSAKNGNRVQADKQKLNGLVEITELSHREKSVSFRLTPQSNGSSRKSANIKKGKPISTISNTFNGPPVFAGSLWFDCTKEFIRKNKDKVVRKPNSEVNGVKTQVLEWEVTEDEKFNAFHSVPSGLKGGFLRLYVSSEFGCALPRVQHLATDGTIIASFDSSEFNESTSGIFIPKKCRMQDFDVRGLPGFYVDYEITDVSALNEQIPDSEFVIKLPVGTVVADSRNGKSSTVFEIQQGGPIPEGLEDIIAVQSPLFWGRNWHSGLIVGAGCGLLVLTALALWRRVLLRRRNS